MKTSHPILCLLLLSAAAAYSQQIDTRKADDTKKADDEALQRIVLLSDVKSLAVETQKLDGPLARALANAEIADAAWPLDRKWTKTLLRNAYRLTYLTEEERRKIGPEPIGTAPRPPTPISRARNEVRRRILDVARQEPDFADQLINDSAGVVTKDDQQMMWAQLATLALDADDLLGATSAIMDCMAVDPTQLILVQLVNDMAVKDRETADGLILQNISNLSVPPMVGRIGFARGLLVLRWLVFPNSFFPDQNRRIPNPGREVMRAYVRYVLDNLAQEEQREPGSLRRERSMLLSTWLPLNQYAPELKERFMQLEALSRTPGLDASLPTKSYEEVDREEQAKQQRETQAGEEANVKEALNLARKGELVSAQNLAERLTRLTSILQVYPMIVQAYARNNDQIGAAGAVRQAMRQVKTVGAKPAPPVTQMGMPAEYARTAAEADGVLMTLAKLAQAVLPVDPLLAAEIADEIVVKANASQIDTSQGRSGIDSNLFRELAAKDEVRTRSAADSFKDRLRRIVTLAAIYQWKARELDQRGDTSRRK